MARGSIRNKSFRITEKKKKKHVQTWREYRIETKIKILFIPDPMSCIKYKLAKYTYMWGVIRIKCSWQINFYTVHAREILSKRKFGVNYSLSEASEGNPLRPAIKLAEPVKPPYKSLLSTDRTMTEEARIFVIAFTRAAKSRQEIKLLVANVFFLLQMFIQIFVLYLDNS